MCQEKEQRNLSGYQSAKKEAAAAADKHRRLAAELESVPCAVTTVTDSRDTSEDVSGQLIEDLLTDAGHEVVDYELLPNDGAVIAARLNELLAREELRFIVFTGGTGLGPKDVTVDTVKPRLEKTLPGFGELFRYMSYREIGPAAMMSRALAGVINQKVVVCLPGSTGAVRLAMEELLIPELRHLVNEPMRIASTE
jgi:molybdenum cofactor biosynthesis protein B